MRPGILFAVCALLPTSVACTGAKTERPVSRAASPAGQSVTLDFFHCGVRPFQLDGEWWELVVQQRAFDQASKPANLSGRGTVVRDGDSLRYTDVDGGTLLFDRDEDGSRNRCA